METLERCRTCGASLSPDIDWCGQCYTPVSSAEEPEGDVIVVPDVVLPSTERLSNERPTSVAISIWGKVALTALLVGFGALAFAWLQELIDVAGSPAWAFTLFFMVTYAALAIVVLALTWRPELTGTRERVIVLPEVESDRRQAALRRSQDPGELPAE